MNNNKIKQDKGNVKSVKTYKIELTKNEAADIWRLLYRRQREAHENLNRNYELYYFKLAQKFFNIRSK